MTGYVCGQVYLPGRPNGSPGRTRRGFEQTGSAEYFERVPPRLKAFWLLAWAVIDALLRRSFRRNVGLAAFREHYDADGLPPVTPQERTNMAGFSRCIACGLCDRGEASRIATSGGAYRGVMSLMLAASRSMPDFRAAAYSFSFVSSDVLRDKERLCPTGVPMVAVAKFVRDKADQVGGAWPLPPRIKSLPPKHKLSPEGRPPQLLQKQLTVTLPE